VISTPLAREETRYAHRCLGEQDRESADALDLDVDPVTIRQRPEPNWTGAAGQRVPTTPVSYPELQELCEIAGVNRCSQA
jgi:hypothetical protein